MLHPFEGAFLFFIDTIIQYTHIHTRVYVHIVIYIHTFIHIFINQSRPSHAERCHNSFKPPTAWEIHSSSKGCWRQSLGSRAWGVPGNGWMISRIFTKRKWPRVGMVTMINLNRTGHLPWLVDPPVSFIANICMMFSWWFSTSSIFRANGTSSGECFLPVFWMWMMVIWFWFDVPSPGGLFFGKNDLGYAGRVKRRAFKRALRAKAVGVMKTVMGRWVGSRHRFLATLAG